VRAALLLWLLCQPALGWSQGPAPRPGKHGQGQKTNPRATQDTARKEHRGTADSPLIVKVVPTPPDQEQLTRESRERQQKAANEEKIIKWTVSLAVGTWILALATFIVSVFTGINLLILKGQGRDLRQQRQVMQTQATHMEEQAVQLKAAVATMQGASERQTGEVRESLRIGQETVGTMQRNAERQLRAYVFAVAASIEGAFSATGGKVVVLLKNSGQTPAYDCIVRYDTRLVSDTKPCPTDEPTRLGQSRGDIAPHEAKRMSIGLRALGSGERAALETVGGGGLMYVFGRIQYTDAFKKQRRQGFCYVFGGIYGSSDSGDLAEAWHGTDST
jgi:hypothetical protein